MAIRIVYTIYLSTIFCDTANFFHLTGLRYTKSSCYAQMKGKDANIKFLNDVLYNRLSSKDIAFKSDKQKLQVLVQAMSLSNVRFTGNYTYNGIHLNANWAYGNYEYTLAIEEKLDSGRNLLYYYPISLLKQDIKTTTNPTFEVQAILVKEFNYRRYARCIYATNKFMHNYNLYTYNVSGKRKINFDKLYFLTPAGALVQNG